MKKTTIAFEITGVLFLLYLGHLTLMASSLPDEVFRPLFAETGPYERMSIMLWLLLAVMLLWALKSVPPDDYKKFIAMGIISLAFAAREANWHKEFTVMSIEKIKFYWSPNVPVMQKLLGGSVVLAAIAILVYLGWLLYRFYKEEQGLQTPVGKVLLFPTCLLPVTKVLDRLPSQVHEIFSTRLPALTSKFMSAYEEGIEMVVPVFFIAAFLLYRQENGFNAR